MLPRVLRSKYLTTTALNTLAVSLMFGGCPVAAYAQGAISEVIVTAQKRAENIQDVPIAISAFSAEMLQDKGAVDLQTLSKFTPGVNLDSGSPFSGDTSVLSASIRGIGQDDFAFNLDPGVGVYIDGVYLARTIGANVNLLDVERVEILKGPQGTLFGRNTIGGAISIVTRTPGDKFFFEGQTTEGSLNRHDFAATADVPLADKLTSSFTVSSVQRDGYQKVVPYNSPTPYTMDMISPYVAGRQTSDNLGGQNAQTIRGKVVWKGIDDLTATVTADWTHQDQSSSPATVLAVLPGAGSIAGLYNACLAGAQIGALCNTLRYGVAPKLSGSNLLPISAQASETGNIDTTYANGPNFARNDNYGAGIVLDYEINPTMNLKSITGFRRIVWSIATDLDGAADNGALFSVSDKQQQRQYSEEVQLTGSAMGGKLNYVGGVYFFNESGFVHDYVPFDGGLLMVDGMNPLETTNYAGYTHADYKVTDQIGLTLGARYSVEEKSFEGEQTDQNGLAYKASGCYPATASGSLIGAPAFLTCQQVLGFPVPGQPYRYFPAGTNHQNFYEFTPTVGLQYHLTDAAMTYWSWSKGTKSGGWTTRLSAPITNAALAAFGPEKATTHEVGFKTSWFQNHLVLDGAGYYTDYDQIQLQQQIGASPVTKNLGSANILGSELEAHAILGGGFKLNAAAGYIDAYYTALDPSVGTAVTLGSKLPKTPKWKTLLSPEYDWVLPNDALLRFGVDYSHTSSMFNDSLNTALLRRPTVDLVDLSVHYDPPGDKYEIVVGGTNITDQRYLTTGTANYAAGFVNGTYSPPGEWYITLRVKF